MNQSRDPLRRSVAGAAKLSAVIATAWLAGAGIAWGPSGEAGVLRVTAAAALCLTPGWLVFAFAGLYGTAAPLGSVIFGMVTRMAAVMAGALVLKAVRPDLADLSFALWLGFFYLLALAVETKLLLAPPRGTPHDE